MHNSEYSQWLNRTGTEVLIERLNDPQQRVNAELDLWNRIEWAMMRRLKWMLGENYQRHIGGDMIVNQAFAEVLEKHANAETTFQDRGDLLRLLMTDAKWRYIDAIRAIQAEKRGGVRDDATQRATPVESGDERINGLMRDLLGFDGNASPSFVDILEAGRPVKMLDEQPIADYRACNQPVDSRAEDSQAAVDRIDLFLQGAGPYIATVIREKVDALPEDLKNVFVLQAVLGLTQEEIAKKLVKSRDFVKYKLELIREHFSRHS